MTIIAAVDDSANAQRALRWAYHQAQLTGSALHVVTALDAPLIGLGYGHTVSQPSPAAMASARHALASLVDAVRTDTGGDSVDVQVEVLVGSPAAAVIEYVEKHDADLLVAGARGSGGLSRMLIGSVSNALVHHAPCPVTVIPG